MSKTENSSEEIFEQGLDSSARLNMNRTVTSPEKEVKVEAFTYIDEKLDEEADDGEFEEIKDENSV